MSKGLTKRRPPRAHRFTERGYKPYVSAIGQFVLAWNDLHEKLGRLFVTIIAAQMQVEETENEELLNSYFEAERWAGLWSSSHYDRPKRALLEALLNPYIAFDSQRFPKFVEDITWILKETDKLEETRNTAVHSPLWWIGDKSLIFQALMGASATPVIPDVTMGNRRAVFLAKAKKDLLKEFRWARDASLTLRNFTISVDRALTSEHGSWPRRPSLPNRGQKKTPQGRLHPARVK